MPKTVEFVVDETALATVKDLQITANFEETAAALREMVAPYASLILDENGVKAAASDRARLRKAAESINDYKKAIKQAYTAPVVEFERKAKELIAIIDTGVSNLDRQIKAYEQAEKQAKIDGLREFFDDNVGDMADFIRFENVLNPRWENKGYAVATAMGEITTAIGRTRADVTAIRDLDSPYAAALLDEYARTHDLGGVIAKNRSLIERDRREAERRAAEEARRAAAAQKPVEPPRPAPEPIQPAPIEETTAPAPADEPLRSVAFRVWGTRQQLMGLAAYMKANGIAYGKVDE